MNKQSIINTISFYTLGCKLNQAESDAIAENLRRRGYSIVPFKAPADLTVINTCTVTNEADSKSRQMIRSAIKTSPDGRVVAMGCYAQIKPKDLAAIDGVDMVLGTNEKYRLPELLEELVEDRTSPLVYVNDSGEINDYRESEFISATGRTRAFLKIQEGCDYYCSYCIIPFARGKARSRRYDECLSEAVSLVSKGYRELVLTGINIGTWNDGDKQLVDLLEGLSQVAGLARIRISSIEPNTVTDRLLKLVNDRPNICPHLHIPIQSGSPAVLKRMRRKYQLDDYHNLARRINRIAPGIALGTDIIAGFPGETEEEFGETISAIEELPFTYLHIFRYSNRDGTVAAKLTDHVDYHTTKKRAAILRQMGMKKKEQYSQKYLESVRPVLFESADGNGQISGMTNNYIRVKVSGDENLSNTIWSVRLIEDCGSYFKGQPEEQL